MPSGLEENPGGGKEKEGATHFCGDRDISDVLLIDSKKITTSFSSRTVINATLPLSVFLTRFLFCGLTTDRSQNLRDLPGVTLTLTVSMGVPPLGFSLPKPSTVSTDPRRLPVMEPLLLSESLIWSLRMSSFMASALILVSCFFAATIAYVFCAICLAYHFQTLVDALVLLLGLVCHLPFDIWVIPVDNLAVGLLAQHEHAGILLGACGVLATFPVDDLVVAEIGSCHDRLVHHPQVL